MDSSFTLTMETRPPDALVTASGELDVFTSRQLWERLQDAVDIGCRRVLLDLGGVSFVDASALRVIDRVHVGLADSDGVLRVVAWSPAFQKLCQLTGMNLSFQVPRAPVG